MKRNEMTLNPIDDLAKVPENTAKLAKALTKRKKNAYVAIADRFGLFLKTEEFAELYAKTGKYAFCPVRLALTVLIQFAEDLSDREVVDAIINRIDLKYFLRLPLEFDGFDHTILSEFRDRLIEGSAEELLFSRILEIAKAEGLLKKEKQRTDSTHVLSAARNMTRVENILETMRMACNMCAKEAPKFTLRVSKKFIVIEAYQTRGFGFYMPRKDADRIKLAETIAKDAKTLLKAIDDDEEMHFLNKTESIKLLRRVLAEQFDDTGNTPKFRKQEDLAPSAHLIGSPHDPDARYSTKRKKTHLGFKLHFTETCEKGFPNLITDVQLTKSTTSDSEMLQVIQRSLRKRELCPAEHIVDAGYTKVEQMRKSFERFEIKTVGPLRGGNSRQSEEGKGFDSSNFVVDWKKEVVICPTGERSESWRLRKSRKVIEVKFPASSCQSCNFKSSCTSSLSGRKMELKTQKDFEFMEKHRHWEKTEDFKERYRIRAGVEGTISQAVKTAGMRRAKYFGLAKVRMQALWTAAAINVLRLADHVMLKVSAKTRIPEFGKLTFPSLKTA